MNALAFMIDILVSILTSNTPHSDVYMPTQMLLWGTVSTCQFWLSGRTSFLITRFFLALFSAGVVGNTVIVRTTSVPCVIMASVG